MKLGFTGTKLGMSEVQKSVIKDLLIFLQPTEFHHGDCTGADAEVHDLVRLLFPKCKIVIHPPIESRLRAFKKGDEIRAILPYMVRNRNIVQSTDDMIAASGLHMSHSGTWHTINYAKKRRPVKVVFPDGSQLLAIEVK